ncbi:MAG: CPBP family intramembrane metalloprotease [Sphingomonas sp.]|nr:CPBP family intramembrane metalloprotease [Sphingomonas sp.]
MIHSSGTRSAEWQPPVSFLPQALREPRRPFRALAVAWATAFVPTLALGAAVTALLPKNAFPAIPQANGYVFWLLVIVSPVLETLLMGAALVLLRRFFSPTLSVLISAVGWGIAHSAAAPGWGLVIWWPFLIFSTLYLVWRQRGVVPALAMAATAHILQNLAPALMVSKLV